MQRESKPFYHKIPVWEKLLAFGFSAEGEYTAPLDNCNLTLTVKVKGNAVFTRVTDCATQEEYVLHLVEEAQGSFVGAVRSAYTSVLQQIAERCFQTKVYTWRTSERLIAWVQATYGDELEYLWGYDCGYAVWRRKDSKKWYAVMMKIPPSRIGLSGEEPVETLNVRLPKGVPSPVDGKRYFPAFHMNKKTWVTVLLSDDLPFDELVAWVQTSYAAAVK